MTRRSWRRLFIALWALSLAAPSRSDVRAGDEFPRELVDFVPAHANPVFTGRGLGHWDESIRERGWILRDAGVYHMWYTGYVDSPGELRRLGYATSPDGLKWTRRTTFHPLVADEWIEDMMVVKRDDTFYMFAEGRGDRAHLLTSKDGVEWKPRGTLDIRRTDGSPLSPGPFGTPTAWIEGDTWYLFYERRDEGIWLAKSSDLKTWTNVSDQPVLAPGPRSYDSRMVALNQIVRHDGRYYAYYHGLGVADDLWTTNVAVSRDLVRWRKYARNPLLPVETSKSSGILVHDGTRFRLYTMHDRVHLHFPRTPLSKLSPAKRSELRFWLENAVVHHRYSRDETTLATGYDPHAVAKLLDTFGIRADVRPAAHGDAIKVLAYPGGRHPRIGFLDGAIDPHRDTKASIFLPWKDAGYVVLDLPEALWTQHGLTYLAHTHIPTIWDKKGTPLERIEWTRRPGGELFSQRRLPDGLEFTARIVPQPTHVDLELGLRNGAAERRSNLRAQVCIMLKDAPGFVAQTNDNKVLDKRYVAVRSDDGKDRWIVTLWQRGRPWANPQCPCMHADPTFPELDPGASSVLRGRLFFHEGSGLEAAVKRHAAALELH